MTLQVVSFKMMKGESLSEPIDCNGGDLIRITMPPKWSGANLTFRVSTDGNGYNDLHDARGGEITMAVVPGSAVPVLNIGDWTRMLGYLQFRSGTAKGPVPQTEDRDFAVTLDVPVAK